jgi:uncharacterized protein (DUF849 family)
VEATLWESVPRSPFTPEQIAICALEAAGAGAAIVHIHVRDPETGKPSRELIYYREVVERVRRSAVDVIINLTGGPGANYFPSPENPAVGGPGTTLSHREERAQHIQELRPEIVHEAGVMPELGVFDMGHIRLAASFCSRRAC